LADVASSIADNASSVPAGMEGSIAAGERRVPAGGEGILQLGVRVPSSLLEDARQEQGGDWIGSTGVAVDGSLEGGLCRSSSPFNTGSAVHAPTAKSH